jgi:bifunctional DNase/RNase
MSHEATIHGVGMVPDGDAATPVVLLDVDEQIIPIFVDPGQAETIERGRNGTPSERPLTHDLFARVIDDLDATVDRIRIDDIADETFYAKLDFTVDRDGETEKFVRDVRPSDGIALAVRVDCPLLVADEVLEAAGQTPEELGLEEAEGEA